MNAGPVSTGLVIALSFLVAPPFGLRLLIASSIGGTRLLDALRDVIVILPPVLSVPFFIALFPDVVLALAYLIMPKFINWSQASARETAFYDDQGLDIRGLRAIQQTRGRDEKMWFFILTEIRLGLVSSTSLGAAECPYKSRS